MTTCVGGPTAATMPAMRYALGLVVIAGCAAKAPPPEPPGPSVVIAPSAPGQLLAPGAFDAITDRGARSRALFVEIDKVFGHPRCANCHTPDDSPRQGDTHAIHDPPVARGAGDRGVAGMQCTGCHQEHNLDLARVPGAPGWHLAPPAMVWLDRSAAQICEQVKDSARNGNRTLAQVATHLAHDPLVGWGWRPGADRAPAPGSQEALAALFLAWVDSGAECPEATKR